MEPVITISPSTDPNVLVNAIMQANIENSSILLMPGAHLTKPGYDQKIKIDGNGLHITGSLIPGEYSSIKRPDDAIDLTRSDNNNGLYFIPSEPTVDEWESVTNWLTYTQPDNTTVEYAVIVRGTINIENVELDCNMGNQGLSSDIADKDIEHSAMLAFAGQSNENTSYPGKRIYVAFEKVILTNIITTRGGYADDIWISRGYFRPNILQVSISKISSNNRVNLKRATISFSGLAQNIEITDADIYQLHSESTSDIWSELPGNASNNQYSNWKLRNINCEVIDLAAKGKAIFLDADNIKSTTSTSLYQIGGLVQNSTFNMLPQATQLIRLNHIIFKDVTWIFSAYQDDRGYFIGIVPRAQYGDDCSDTFIQNSFLVNGDLINNAQTKAAYLIETEFSVAELANNINLRFESCSFDPKFINSDVNKAYIAKVDERGTYEFLGLGFNESTFERSFVIKSQAIINSISLTI